jgi:hypothetical protein
MTQQSSVSFPAQRRSVRTGRSKRTQGFSLFPPSLRRVTKIFRRPKTRRSNNGSTGTARSRFVALKQLERELPKKHTTARHPIYPQRSNCLSTNLDAEISGADWLGTAMTDQETDTLGAVIPYAPEPGNASSEADLVDRAGNAILGLVNRAASTAAADLKEARDVAERLALQLQASRDQLRAADDQINALNAEVRRYRDRANRAEKWLQQISSEIEQKFLGANDSHPARRRAAPQTENNNPTSLSFLRRREAH